MRLNKSLFYFTGMITAISLLLYIVFTTKFKNEFWSNLFCGIFSSGFFAWIVSIIGYLNERKKTLEKFCIYVRKIRDNFSLYNVDATIEQKVKTVNEMAKYDYLEFDNAYADISFIFFNKRFYEKYIAGTIYKMIIEKREILKKNANKIKVYSGESSVNNPPIQDALKEIEESFYKIEVEDIKDASGSTCRRTSIYPYFAISLTQEINGGYYKIMYPMQWIKSIIENYKSRIFHKEEQHNAD